MVDDDPDLLDIARVFLSSDEEWEIATSPSGVEALELLHSDDYDVVVSDYQMPSMNGVELLRTIRAKGNKIPFILFTGKGREEIAIEALNAGADYYIKKGMDIKSQFAELSRAISRCIEHLDVQRRLITSEERFRRAVEATKDGIWEYDIGHGSIYLSPRCFEILHMDPDQFEFPRSFVELAHPEASSDLSSIMKNMARGKVPLFDREVKIARGDGEDAWMMMRAKTFKENGNARPTRIIGTLQDITERKNLEEGLKQLKDLYERILQVTSDGILMFDADQRITFVNEGMVRMTGFSREQIMSMNAIEMLPPQAQSIISIAEEAIKDLSTRSYDTICTRFPNGRAVYHRGELIPMMSNGAFSGLTVMVHDETRRILAEQNLFRKDHEDRLLGEVIPGVAFSSKDFGSPPIPYGATEKLTGYTEEDFRENPGLWMSLVYEEDRSRVIGMMRSMPHHEGQMRVEYRLVTKNGEVKWVRDTIIPVFGPEGEFTGVKGYCMDISLQKAGERERDRGKAYQEIAGNFMGIGQWSHHPGSDGIDPSPSVSQILFGVKDLSTVSFQQISDVLDPTEADDLRSSIRHLYATGEPFEVDVRTRLKKGKCRWLRFIGTGVMNASGGVCEVIGMVMDITDRKLEQRRLCDLTKKLELVGKLTRHDIANHLFVSNANLELAMEVMEDGEAKEHLMRSIRSNKSIEGHLEFSKTYMGLGMRDPIWIGIREAIEIGSSTLELGEVELNIDLDDITVLADPMIQRVFHNLIGNSIKHGERVTAIQITSRIDDDQLKLSIKDNGIGIPDSRKGCLFDEQKMHGLGLVKEILAITGIEIRENGEPGSGAQFEITVPPGAFR